ncbi:MAG: hypothetical protein HY319_12965 [Armatimonadetes bacterium]|nr:hypothetical protein [Armatimonadota bacterium]
MKSKLPVTRAALALAVIAALVLLLPFPALSKADCPQCKVGYRDGKKIACNACFESKDHKHAEPKP